MHLFIHNLAYMGELLFSSQLRTKYKTTMWYLETGLYLCITVGRISTITVCYLVSSNSEGAL